MFRFYNRSIYRAARKVRLSIEKEVLPRLPADEKFALGNQLRRAMNSVILNIVEGSYRKSDKDFAHFLNQAQTSLYEVVSCFDLMEDSGAEHYITNSYLLFAISYLLRSAVAQR